MIDERFSFDSFARLGTNTNESAALARDLQRAIADELADEICDLATKIAALLSARGHQCTRCHVERDPDGAIFIEFVDVRNGDARGEHLLRFNLDLIVSAGFPGYVPEESEPLGGAT